MTKCSIDREKFKTETGKKLFDMLVDIWDDDDFVTGVLCNVKGDERRQKMIKALENNLEDYEFDDDEYEYTDKVLLLSVDIANGEV